MYLCLILELSLSNIVPGHESQHLCLLLGTKGHVQSVGFYQFADLYICRQPAYIGFIYVGMHAVNT